MTSTGRVSIAISIMVAALAGGRAVADGCLFDAHNRDITSYGVTLVDWEGQIANPAIPLHVTPPVDGVFPVTLTMTADNGRLFFSKQSAASVSGPRKVMVFETFDTWTFYMSIYPDRDGDDELHTMMLTFVDAAQKKTEVCIDVRVIDQDRDRPNAFRIHTDFNCDESGFFRNPKARAVVEQAAADWAYFIDDMQLDVVGPGQEDTRVWTYPQAWEGSQPRWRKVINRTGYEGFLLYAYGLLPKDLIPRGGTTAWRCQHANGKPLPMRRSGGIHIHPLGCYNTLGWVISIDDDEWQNISVAWHQRSDLYSVALHEVAHALAFDEYHPGFRKAMSSGLQSPRLLAYTAKPMVCNKNCHFSECIDPCSAQGAFGNKYVSIGPAGRWLITKLDLLALEAVGYKLRKTSALEPLEIERGFPPVAEVGVPYAHTFRGHGGVPAYHWSIGGGALPDGLSIDSFTGEVTGTPTKAWLYRFNPAVSDAWNATTSINCQSILVRDAPTMGTMRPFN